MAARFEVYQDIAGNWRWRLKDGNNLKVATSGESFSSMAAAKRAARNVRDAASTAYVEGDEDAMNAALRRIVARRASGF
jgi:uncharacterized protein YegP (UPF0339 family)